jgi:hypothetical protein
VVHAELLEQTFVARARGEDDRARVHIELAAICAADSDRAGDLRGRAVNDGGVDDSAAARGGEPLDPCRHGTATGWRRAAAGAPDG